MKKTFKIFYLFSFFAIIFISLVGCFAEISNEIVRIEITRMPETTFPVSSTTPTIQFELKAINSDGTEISSINQNTSGVTVTGFSTSKVGTYTATIKYQGVSAQFTYYVVEPTGFLGGNGTKESPYLISNAKQFLNILNTREKLEGLNRYGIKKHFKLVADINFENVSEEELAAYNSGMSSTWFMGSLDGLKSDGKKHKIVNYRSTSSLFKFVMDATFSNFDLEDCVKGGTSGALLTYGSSEANWGAYPIKDEIVFYDVDILEGSQSVVAAYMIFSYKQVGKTKFTKVVFENCDNYATITGGVAGEDGDAAAFGWNVYGAELTNCKNYGDIYGRAQVGAFVTMGVTKMVNCVNEGNIYYSGSNRSSIYIFNGHNNGNATKQLSGCVNKGTVFVGQGTDTNVISDTKFDENCTNEASPKVSRTLISFASDAITINSTTRVITFTQLSGDYSYKINIRFNSDYYLVNEDGTATFTSGGYPRSVITWDYVAGTQYIIPYVYQVLPANHGITNLPKYTKQAPAGVTQSGIASDGNYYHFVQSAELLNLISGSFSTVSGTTLNVTVTVTAYDTSNTPVASINKGFTLVYPAE